MVLSTAHSNRDKPSTCTVCAWGGSFRSIVHAGKKLRHKYRHCSWDVAEEANFLWKFGCHCQRHLPVSSIPHLHVMVMSCLAM